MTPVGKYMTPGPHTIGREQSLEAAKQLMHRTHVRHLPVLHGGKLVGLVSERDLDVVGALPGSRQLAVEDAMVPDVYVISEDASLAKVAADMARLKVGSAVVLKGEQVVGVFTAVDGLRALAELLRPLAQEQPAAPA
ncbi:MAG TPA: CBS domain-containing protein [Polyangia bacterium]|jgi:acetoin utilization protein AcuB|nr:CBS domain-containing protein [Polyangia bacterium]